MSDDLLSIFNDLDDTESKRESYLRAPFGWPGGKSLSLQYILPRLPDREAYVEVCGGSGIVLLNRKPSKLEVYNDRYSGVVAFYRCLRDPVKKDALVEKLSTTIHAREEFVWCASTWENCDDDVERAYRWYYMIYMSFSGLGRNFGRSTSGKALFGSKLHNILRHFEGIHQRMRNVQVENQDWTEILRDYDGKNVVFYIDPPYMNTDVGIYKHKFTTEDHTLLCERIFRCRGFVALSGYDNSIYDKFPWDEKTSWDSNVTVSSLAKTETNNLKDTNMTRRTAQETLWIKEAK